MINITLPWPPTVNTYYRSIWRKNTTHPVVLLSAKGRQYKEDATAAMVLQDIPQNLGGRIEVLIEVYPPDRRRRDLDNLLKPILDVLEDYGVFYDDEQIDIIHVRRRTKGGRVEVFVSEIPDSERLDT